MKTLYIVRGLDGSGKSNLAQQLCPWWHPNRRAIAADDYPGRYLPDGTLNPAIPHSVAQAWVQDRVESWMQQGIGAIAVHNVFSLTKWFDPYLVMAQQHRYSVQVIHCEGVVLPCGSRATSIHAVPSDRHQKWANEWESF